MRAVWTLTLLVACHGVGQTGPRGLKGRLLDQDGQPIANQYITTVEGGAETAEDGTFEVRWKEPNTSATFTRAGMDWRRSLLPDDPPVVDIALPHTAEGEISCRSELRCMAELAWDLGGGLSAHHELECGERTPVARIPSLPPGEPTVVCSTVKGDLDLAISRANGRISITSKPQPRPVGFVASGVASNIGMACVR